MMYPPSRLRSVSVPLATWLAWPLGFSPSGFAPHRFRVVCLEQRKDVVSYILDLTCDEDVSSLRVIA